MKTLARLTMATALALALGACGSASAPATTEAASEDAAAPETEPMGGGWQVSEDAAPSLLTPEQAEVYQKAMEDHTHADNEPVSVIGQQVVAGMNYAYLCKASAVKSDVQPMWNILVVYAALDGSATFTSASPLELGAVRTLESAAPEEAVGAWEAPEPTVAAALPAEVQGALDAQTSYELVPQALLGSQVVAGTNYQVLCIGRPTADENARYRVYDATVYVDLEGKAEVTSLAALDIISYVNPSA